MGQEGNQPPSDKGFILFIQVENIVGNISRRIEQHHQGKHIV